MNVEEWLNEISDFDSERAVRDRWGPRGCDIEPWFLPGPATEPAKQHTWEAALRYRPEKLAWVRRRLEGIERDEALRKIMRHVWAKADSERERFEKLVVFVGRMMVHPPVEQPMEADAAESWRRECCPATDQAAAYAEDLQRGWAKQAYEQAKAFGRHLGLWCNPLGVRMRGDWGLRGVVSDALELLMLHEGRCGHQAKVVVQLAQAGGWHARLTQLNCHRVAEVLLEGRWVLADSDAWLPGFIGTTEHGKPASIEWCVKNRDRLGRWQLRPELQIDYANYFQPGGAAEERNHWAEA